jgi:hypothetical protein
MRSLKNGKEAMELDQVQEYSIKTKCPEKWILLDLETGEVYTPHIVPGPYDWKKIDRLVEIPQELK